MVVFSWPFFYITVVLRQAYVCKYVGMLYSKFTGVYVHVSITQENGRGGGGRVRCHRGLIYALLAPH